MAAFGELGVIPQLCQAVSAMGWELPTAIQNDAIPAILGGGDVLIAAETGSGKTGAFCLPVSQIVWEKRKDALYPKPNVKKTEAPTFKLNQADRDAGLAIDGTGLACESRTQKLWFGCRATAAVHSKGKYYYEATITRDGLCRVGWSTSSAVLNLGTDDKSFGFGGTGKKSHKKKFDDYGTSFTTNDVLGCFLDLDKFQIWWSINGQEFPIAYRLEPLFADPTNALHPAVLVQNSSLTLNFGATPFRFPPDPAKGFVAIASAPESCLRWRTAESRAADAAAHPNAPLGLIFEPTRELIEQTHNNLVSFAKELQDPPLRCLSVAAGVSMPAIISEVRKGVDVVTGTLGRVVDLIESGELSLTSLQFLVMDEADQILSNRDTARLVARLYSHVPLITSDGSRLQDRHMHFPQWVDLKGMDTVSETVHHVICPVDASSDKQWIRLWKTPNRLEDDFIHARDTIKAGSNERETLSLGTKILKGEYVVKAIRALNMEQAIIFCRTKQQCDQLETFLNNKGLKSVCLHGDRSPQERSQSLADFKEKRVPFLICTDVAARGIDVQGVPYVINVTLPDDKLVYLHRIGRVGRAERMGLSISLVSVHAEKVWYHGCKTRGANCNDTREVAHGGCGLWYDEHRLLGDIEEHIGQTIATTDSDFNIPVNEFDGKIVYGAKRGAGTQIEGHASQLKTAVAQLVDLERSLQYSYLTGVASVFNKIKVL